MSAGAMWGADPEALEQLARELDSAAKRLESLHGRLRVRVHASPWRGRVADRFRADWDGVHRAAITSAAGQFREAGQAVRRNAADQLRASAADGGWSGGSSAAGTPSLAPSAAVVGGAVGGAGLLGTLRAGMTWVDRAGDVAGVLNGISKFGYGTAWTQLQQAFPRWTNNGEFFMFRKSPVVKWVEQWVRNPSPAAGALKWLEDKNVLKAVGFVGLANSGLAGLDAGRRGDALGIATSTATLAGDAVKLHPAGRLLGAAISVVSLDVELARDLDFSAEGWQAVRNASVRDWAESAMEAPGKVAGRVWDSIF